MNNWTMADIERKGLKVCKSTSLKPPISGGLKNNNTAIFALGRMKARKMNKTEAAYCKVLEAKKHIGEVVWFKFEPFNIHLADKCFYKIDFGVMLANGQFECHEVKGRWQEDALVKIKVAAEILPFRFIAVRLVKGNWEVRDFSRTV